MNYDYTKCFHEEWEFYMSLIDVIRYTERALLVNFNVQLGL